MRGPVLADVCERITEFLLAQPVLLSVSNTVLQHEDSTASASQARWIAWGFLPLCCQNSGFKARNYVDLYCESDWDYVNDE